MKRKTAGVNGGRKERAPFLQPTVGQKLDIECRGEARREGMHEDEQIADAHTHVEP